MGSKVEKIVEMTGMIVDRVLSNPDQISSVLQGHLIVESQLNDYFGIFSDKDWAGKVGIKQFSYVDKLSILYGFGFIDKKLYTCLNQLGVMRNKLALRSTIWANSWGG